MKKILKYFLPWLISRTGILYIVLVLVLGNLIDLAALREGITVRRLNNLSRKTHETLARLINKKSGANEIELSPLIQYYETVLDTHPRMNEARGLLGYARYHIGQVSAARELDQEAVANNPDFFWYYYNLAVLDYWDGRYQSCIRTARKALAVPADNTLRTISESPMVYRPLAAHRQRAQSFNIVEELEGGYVNLLIVLADSLRREGLYRDLWQVASLALKNEDAPQGYFHLMKGLSAFHMRDARAALEELKLAIEDDPAMIQSYHFMERLIRKNGQDEAANLFRDKAAMLDQKKDTLEKYPAKVTLAPY